MHAKRHKLGNLLVAAGLAVGPGCLTLAPTPIELPPDCVKACQQVPCCSRGKVFVILVDGLDPLCNVSYLRQSLIGLGFNKVYDGHFYHAPWFIHEIRRLHAEEPEARFAVVGVSTGADAARLIVEGVAKDDIAIDVFALIDGPLWPATTFDKPANVRQFVHLTDARCAAQPLADELTAVAGTIPVITVLPSPPTDGLPTPRPVVPREAKSKDAWDFLLPMARLDEPLPNTEIAPVLPPGERAVAK